MAFFFFTGNILALKDGSLGLIDYGQTKSISNDERLGIARVVDALGNGYSKGEVADAMRKLGFKTKFDKDEILAKYATLFFDSDIEGKLIGCATPQLYFATLTQSDPLVNVPDVASKCAYEHASCYTMNIISTSVTTFPHFSILNCSICCPRKLYSSRNGNTSRTTDTNLLKMVFASQAGSARSRTE